MEGWEIKAISNFNKRSEELFFFKKNNKNKTGGCQTKAVLLHVTLLLEDFQALSPSLAAFEIQSAVFEENYL